MNEYQKHLLNIYCGMWEARAEVLMKIERRTVVNGASLRHFIDAGMVDGGYHLNSMGTALLEKVKSIYEVSFKPEPPTMLLADLAEINPTRCARWEVIRVTGMKSAHIKALVALAHHPGEVYCSMVPGFGYATLNYLLTDGWINLKDLPGEGRNNLTYAVMHLSTRAIALLGLCHSYSCELNGTPPARMIAATLKRAEKAIEEEARS